MGSQPRRARSSPRKKGPLVLYPNSEGSLLQSEQPIAEICVQRKRFSAKEQNLKTASFDQHREVKHPS